MTGRVHSESGLAPYLETVQELWPETAPPRPLRRGEGSATAGQFVAFPSARSPRLLVPAGNRVAASRAMLRFSSGLDVRDTAKRLAVAALLRGGLDRIFPDRVGYSGDGPSLAAHLGEVIGEQVDVSIGLGPARANRKPVLQVFDRSGRSRAFVKVGTTELSAGHVAHEAQALRELAEADLPPELSVPEVLWYGEWNGLLVLMMSALDTTPRQRPSRQWDVPVGTMTAFSRAFGEGSMPLEGTPWWAWAAHTPRLLSGEQARDRLAEALDGLRALAGEREFPVGAWHGDWTPWNQSRRRGRLQLWDWERFERGVPTGFDRAHYGVNAYVRRHGRTVESVLAGLGLAGLSPSGDDGAARVLGAAYLAAITCRYLRSAEGELGELIADRGQLMLSALAECLAVARR